MERKIKYLRKEAILDTVAELKHRFRKVLSLYLLKKDKLREPLKSVEEADDLESLKDLIENFDKSEDY